MVTGHITAKAGKVLKHAVNNAPNLQNAVDVFNMHAKHIHTKTFDELCELINQELI